MGKLMVYIFLNGSKSQALALGPSELFPGQVVTLGRVVISYSETVVNLPLLVNSQQT